MSRDSDRSKAEIFVNHVKNHLEGKDQQVMCKICNKTLDEIVKEETNKGIWLADGIYDAHTKYIDRNGKNFKIMEIK